MKGTVNWFNIKKGYGFIKGEDGEDYFVHYTAVPKETFLRENDIVSFEPTKTEKGKQAKDVKLLEKGSQSNERYDKEEEFDDEK